MTTKEQGAEEAAASSRTVRLTILGKELLVKKVAKSGQTGRVYLPVAWVGKTVKIVRIN